MRESAKKIWRGLATGVLTIAMQPAHAQAPSQYSIEKLIADGWEIAGFAPSLAMVGSVILFRHKDRNFFVQCTAVYDATRPRDRVVTNCYEIR